MGRLHTTVLVGSRMLFVAMAFALLTPKAAQAADIWCRWFGAGCSDGGSASQNSARETPEIDPNALGSAIALAAGGAAIFRDRVRRRR